MGPLVSAMTDLAEFFDAAPESDPLRDDIMQMIKDRHDGTPRHLQKELGPSEIGHPCMRRMALGMMDEPRCNPSFDPLPSIIGTATHKWLESAAEYANQKLGRVRWLTERRVHVSAGLSGSCDLYDTDSATVIDYKVPGNNRFNKYRKDPGPVYRNQVFLYGKGFENAGLPVKRVAIALIPRGGTLRSMHLWQEEYSSEVADRILHRRNQVIALMHDFEVESNPERYQWIPISPYDCQWCPWFHPEPKTPIQCQGDQ